MRKGWAIKRLGEVCQVNPRERTNSLNTENSEVSFIPMSAIDEKAGVIWAPEVREQRDVAKGYTSFRDNDVLFAKITPCMQNGKAAIARGLVNGIGFGSTEFHVLRPGPEVKPEWVFAFVRQANFKRVAEASFTGTAGQQRVPTSFMTSSLIPVPPLPEQERIVSILDAAEELRRLREQADRRTADLIPALFHKMFGDPAMNQRGWPKEVLGESTHIDAPMVDPRKPEYLDLPHIGADRIEKATGKLLQAKSATEDKLISGKFVFDARYVLYSKIRPYLRKAALPEGKGLCSADIYPVRPKEKKMTREFLWSILLSDTFTDYTASLSTRANMPKINRKQFESYMMILPPLPLQKEYSARVAGIRAMVTQQAESRHRIDDLFQSLLHRAFQGEL